MFAKCKAIRRGKQVRVGVGSLAPLSSQYSPVSHAQARQRGTTGKAGYSGLVIPPD